MRKVVFTCIALIVLGASWLLFLEHHKRRFEDSLPKVPVSVTQPVDTADSPLNTEKAVDIGAPVLEPSLIEDTPAARDSSLIENAAFQDADSLESSEEVEVSFEESSTGHDSQVSSGERGKALAVPPNPAHLHCEGSALDWRKMSEEEVFDRQQEELIRQFGDIPEVHIFMESLRAGPEHQRTTAETLRLTEAILTLFPSEANRRAVEMVSGFQLQERTETSKEHSH